MWIQSCRTVVLNRKWQIVGTYNSIFFFLIDCKFKKTNKYGFEKTWVGSSVVEPSHFSPAPASDFFSTPAKKYPVSAPASPRKSRPRPAPAPKNSL